MFLPNFVGCHYAPLLSVAIVVDLQADQGEIQVGSVTDASRFLIGIVLDSGQLLSAALKKIAIVRKVMAVRTMMVLVLVPLLVQELLVVPEICLLQRVVQVNRLSLEMLIGAQVDHARL